MNVVPDGWFARHGAPPRRLLIAMLATLGGVAVMLLSSQQMSDLRVAVPQLSQAMSWLEGLPLPLDMDHVAFFALVAVGLRLLLPDVRVGWMLLGLAAMAVGTELLQFLTVGRTPSVLDARDDMIGASIGLLVGSVPQWFASRSGALLKLSDAALLVGILLLPIQQWSPLGLFGYPLSASDLMFAAAIAVRGFGWLGGNAPLQWSGFHGWLAAYLLAMLLAVLVLSPVRIDPGLQGQVCPMPSASFAGAMAKWLGVAYLAMVALVASDAMLRTDNLRRAVWAWILAGLGASLLSIAAVTGFYMAPDVGWLQHLLNHYGSLPPGDYPRVRATFNYASMFCSFMTVAVALVLAAREAGWLRGSQCAWLLTCMVLGTLPALTPELGGMALVLGVGAQRALDGRAPRLGRAVLVLAVLLALLMLLVASRSLVAPLDAPSQRWEIWQQAWQSVQAHPWRGIGLGVPVVGVAFLDPSGGMQWLTDAHNLWLSIAGQAGVPAAAAFGGLVFHVIRRGLRALAADGSAARLPPMLAIALAALVGYQGLVGSFEDARHLWVLIGVLAGVAMACARIALPPACSDMHAPSPDVSNDAQRRAIAGWIVGSGKVSPAALVEVIGVDAVLDAIEREGVLSLVHARFADTHGPHGLLEVPDALRAELATRARVAAARGLLCLAEARRIQQSLDAAGISALWMKGMALGHWLYPQPHLRDIADMDLLLPDHATTLQAAAILAPLGYELPNPHIAGDLVVHELLAWSARAQLELDLHWDVSNDALFAGRLRWGALADSAIPLPGLSVTAQGLSPLHALLHAVMHRAANYRSGRENRLRWLYDIHLLACGLTARQWQEFATLAVTYRVAGPCLDALRAVQALLGTSVPDGVARDLQAAVPAEFLQAARLRRWAYFQWANWQALPDLRTRLRWLRQLLLPDMAHLRARYGDDGAGATRVLARRLADGWQRWRGYHRAVE